MVAILSYYRTGDAARIIAAYAPITFRLTGTNRYVPDVNDGLTVQPDDESATTWVEHDPVNQIVQLPEGKRAFVAARAVSIALATRRNCKITPPGAAERDCRRPPEA